MPDVTVSASVDAFMVAANQAAMRTALGLGTMALETASNYLTTAAAVSTYAPLASPTFTGTVTIPSGASIAGYLTTAAAAAAYQPLDADLTAIAALTTTTFGRSLLTQADATAARTTLGLGTAATQASTAFLQLAGGAQTVAGSQTTTFSAAVASISPTTGAVVISAGGLGVAGSFFVSSTSVMGFGNNRGKIFSSGDGFIGFLNNAAGGFSGVNFGLADARFTSLASMPGNGLQFLGGAGSSTFQDNSTATSGTIANRNVLYFPAPTYTATNASTTVTNPATVRIGGAPTASGVTFTNTAMALWVENGLTRFDGTVTCATNINVGSNINFNSSSTGVGNYWNDNSSLFLSNSGELSMVLGGGPVIKFNSADGGVIDFASQSIQNLIGENVAQYFLARVGGATVKIALLV